MHPMHPRPDYYRRSEGEDMESLVPRRSPFHSREKEWERAVKIHGGIVSCPCCGDNGFNKAALITHLKTRILMPCGWLRMEVTQMVDQVCCIGNATGGEEKGPSNYREYFGYLRQLLLRTL